MFDINLRAVRERKYVNKLNKTDAINYVFEVFFSVRVVFCLKFITITQVQRDLVRVRSRVNAATLRYDRRRN